MNKTKWSLVGLLCFMLMLSYTNCQKKKTDEIQTVDAITALKDYQCGGATFVSDTYAVNTSINAQNSWYSDPAANFDEKILNIGSQACRGNGVWHISNAVTSGGFGNQPISPAFTKANGETTVRTAGAGDSMAYSFFFRTKSSVADGSSVTLSLSPTSADRHDYLRILNHLDASGGLQLISIDGVGLVSKNIVQNISRGIWHHILLTNTNPDGTGNDVVKVYLDGSLVSTHTSWEDWRTAIPATTLAVTRILFRLNVLASTVDPSFTATPEGFYIDDFEQRSFDSSSPSTAIESYSTGFEN